MRDSFAEIENHERHGLSMLCRWVVIAFFVIAFCSVASAQLEPLRDRGVHTLYGDVKVEADQESSKPLSLEIQLYIINGTLIGRQSVSANGRYRFMDLRNGEYDVVVMSENTEVARVRVRVESVYKTDFRQDIALGAKTDRRASKAGTVSVSEVYVRTPANKTLFEKAQKAIDEKKYDEALDRLNQLVAADAKDCQGWTELGTVQLIRSNADEAEKAYRRAIQECPSFAQALINLGRLLSVQKKYDAAIEPLSEAVKSSPTSADANFLLGEAYLQIKKGSKAVPYLNEAAKLGKADAHLRLALLYNGAGMKDKAVLEYEQFLKKNPDYKDRKALEQYISENKKP